MKRRSFLKALGVATLAPVCVAKAFDSRPVTPEPIKQWTPVEVRGGFSVHCGDPSASSEFVRSLADEMDAIYYKILTDMPRDRKVF